MGTTPNTVTSSGSRRLISIESLDESEKEFIRWSLHIYTIQLITFDVSVHAFSINSFAGKLNSALAEE